MFFWEFSINFDLLNLWWLEEKELSVRANYLFDLLQACEAIFFHHCHVIFEIVKDRVVRESVCVYWRTSVFMWEDNGQEMLFIMLYPWNTIMKFKINEIMLNQGNFQWKLNLKPLVRCALVIDLDTRFMFIRTWISCTFCCFLEGINTLQEEAFLELHLYETEVHVWLIDLLF